MITGKVKAAAVAARCARVRSVPRSGSCEGGSGGAGWAWGLRVSSDFGVVVLRDLRLEGVLALFNILRFLCLGVGVVVVGVVGSSRALAVSRGVP